MKEICHVEGRITELRETRRLCKDGGYLVNVEVVLEDGDIFMLPGDEAKRLYLGQTLTLGVYLQDEVQ